MSFEILEYPLKKWILDVVDDKKIESEIFDLLGEPDICLKYPSLILYDVDTLIEHEPYNLVVKLEIIDRNDAEYKFDLKSFAECRKVSGQLLGILHDSNTVLQMIVKTIDAKWVKMFELDKMYVAFMNGMKLKLCYEGNDQSIIKRISNLYMYGFRTTIEYENDSSSDSDDEDDIEAVKKILSDLSNNSAT